MTKLRAMFPKGFVSLASKSATLAAMMAVLYFGTQSGWGQSPPRCNNQVQKDTGQKCGAERSCGAPSNGVCTGRLRHNG